MLCGVCGEMVGGQKNGERLWPDGSDGMRHDQRAAFGTQDTLAGLAGVECQGLCAGWKHGASACGRRRRDLHCGIGIGAGVLEAARIDGGTVPAESPEWNDWNEWQGRRAVVPDGGYGTVAGERNVGLSGASGSAGKDPWLPDRIGRDRSGVEGAGGSSAGGGGSADGGKWKQASGGLCGAGGGCGARSGIIARAIEGASARLHGSVGLCDVGGLAAATQRQTRSAIPSRAPKPE